MKILKKNIFPRNNLRLLKDALCRFSEIFVDFISGNAEKRFSYVDRYACRRLIEYYHGRPGQKIDKTSGNLGFGFLHHAIIRILRPRRILCIGSGRGFIPAICALACKENRFGSVDFVDAGYDRNHPMSWGGDGFWKRIDPQKHFSLLGFADNINVFVMTSKEYCQRYPRRKYGYIYIDGDHSYEGVKSDYEMFWPRLEKRGFMVFHDISARGGGAFGFGVWKFWQEIKNDHKIFFPFRISGLGILMNV